MILIESTLSMHEKKVRQLNECVAEARECCRTKADQSPRIVSGLCYFISNGRIKPGEETDFRIWIRSIPEDLKLMSDIKTSLEPKHYESLLNCAGLSDTSNYLTSSQIYNVLTGDCSENAKHDPNLSNAKGKAVEVIGSLMLESCIPDNAKLIELYLPNRGAKADIVIKMPSKHSLDIFFDRVQSKTKYMELQKNTSSKYY